MNADRLLHVNHVTWLHMTTSNMCMYVGQIGYALVPLVARGHMFGPNQPVILHLLDIEPARTSLEGVKMELIDAAYPLLQGVVVTTNVVEACRWAHARPCPEQAARFNSSWFMCINTILL
jgi:hypothetical protein